MFGYILVNPKTLTKDEKARYRAAYCGMCRQLRAYGAAGRAALSYDMTFIALLLNSVYMLDETSGSERCAMRPVPTHDYFTSDAIAYAADMNILMAYYKELDDWNDDHDKGAFARSEKLGVFIPGITQKWPAQAGRASECMAALSAIEKLNILNPDEPANCFAALMGEILDWKGASMRSGSWKGASMHSSSWKGASLHSSSPGLDDPENKSAAQKCADEKSDGLRRMGEALGRFLYLLDANNDLHNDIRKERYNPLVAQMDMNFEPMLTMMIGECTNEFEQLGAERDLRLLRNVLYSGVWMRYKNKGNDGGQREPGVDREGGAT